MGRDLTGPGAGASDSAAGSPDPGAGAAGPGAGAADPGTGALPRGGAGADAEAAARLRLGRLPGVGDHAIRRLLERFGSAVEALRAPAAAIARVAGGAAAESRTDRDHLRAAEEAVRRSRELGIRILLMGAEGYPSGLLHLHDPPPLLFCRGDPALLEGLAVAVVGSRRSSESGRRVAERIGRALSAAGVRVVSGLALGIDAAAHRGALEGPGGTVAVLGCGCERAYPPGNRSLYVRIAREGLVLSEFPPGTPALPHHFPRRNRIMAALARATVVVEAGRRSGALITAGHAADLGRDVWAVPGPVEGPGSRGSNALLRDGVGAVVDPDRVVEELGLDTLLPRPAGSGRSHPGGPPDGPSGAGAPPPGDDGRVWRLLSEEPASVDRLVDGSGLPSGRVLAALARLELEGRASRWPGMRFRREGR